MNSFSHQYLYQKELEKKGINFKSIYGNEAYFIDSQEDWEELYKSEKNRKFLESLLLKI
jgi:hypothetical protein